MKRTLAVLLSLLAILLGVLVAVPLIFGEKLMSLAKEKANQSINAKLDWSDFDITVFRSFPDLTLVVNNLKITGVDEFAGVDLASVGSFGITVDLKSVISGNTVVVKGLEMDRPNFNVLVLENGKANYDIVKPSAEETTSVDGTSLKIALQEYSLNKGNIIYNDRSLKFSTELRDLNHSGEGNFTLDVFDLKTETEVKNLSVSYGGVKYLKRVPTKLVAQLGIDVPNMRFTFKDNALFLNKLELGIDGTFEMPDDEMVFDLALSARKNEFKNLLTLLPEEFTRDFKNVKAQGKMALNAHLKGTMNDRIMPGFDVKLLVENGSVKYPQLPKSADNINIQASVVSPGGVNYNNTVVDVSQFHMDIAGNPFDMTLKLSTPITDPHIDTKIQAQLDLNNIKDVLPLENTKIGGKINADVAVKGKMSDLEAQRYENFEAGGYVELANFKYKSDSLPEPLYITNAVLRFNPKMLNMPTFVASYGETKLKANGALTNYLAYVLKNDTLRGTLYVQASMLDLNNFMSGDQASTSTASSNTGIIKVPANINFELHSVIDQLIYDKLVISNFGGDLIVRDQSVRIQNTSMRMLGGYAVINGLYSSKGKDPEFSFDIDVNRLDINKTANTLATVALFAPLAKNATGTFASKLSVKGILDQTMTPVYSSMSGSGLAILNNVFFENFEPFNKLASELKVSRLAKQKIADTKLSFDIANGKLIVSPFDTKFGPIPARIAGSTSFDQQIDYVLNLTIPRKEFGEAANEVINGLSSKASAAIGQQVALSEYIDVEVFMTNTVTEPKIRTNLKERGRSAVDAAKNKLQGEVDKKKQEIEDKLKLEEERLRKEAEERARQEQERLRKEAENATNAAKEKANQELEKAKEDAKKKVKGLFGKPK